MAPLLFDGGFQFTVAEALPGVAVTDVGAPAAVRGVLGAEVFDADPVPAALVAVTLNV